MGLDMYLVGKRYLSNHRPSDVEVKNRVLESFPELRECSYQRENPVNEVTAEVGYWRKANAIHSWFVQNVQNGEDDCGHYSVNREDLNNLRDVCQTVLDNPDRAADLLPTTSGFFFGSTEYNDYYTADLRQTIKIVDAALKLSDEWDISYHSSW